MSRINRLELVKSVLPDAIRQTPRETFIYQMDGEDQVYPTYREAATSLAKELGLGERKVDSAEIEKRMGKVKVVYTNLEAMQRASGGRVTGQPAPLQPRRGRRPKVSAEAQPGAEVPQPTRRAKTAGRQQRSIAVELPQSALRELLSAGRAKVMLRVKAR